MNVDPKSKAVTNFFMVAAVIVMLLLAWSVASDNDGNSDRDDAESPQPAAE